MAASRSMRRSGCSVTMVASSGLRQMSSSEWRAADLAVLRHVAAGLAHEPDGRAIDRLAPAGAEKSTSLIGLRLMTQGSRQKIVLQHKRFRP